MTDPDLYAFDDYRDYLRAWFKDRNGRPSQATFAARIHCTRPLLTAILKGDRRMLPSRARHCAEQLGLDGDRAEYLLALIEAADGDAFETREEAARRAQAMRRLHRRVHDVQLLAGLYQDWLRAVLFELCKRADFRADPRWIADHVRPQVTPDHAADALAWLRAAGLLRRGADAELQGVAARAWSERQEPGHDTLVEASLEHRGQFLDVAAQILPKAERTQRFYSTATALVSRERAQALREAALRFEKEVLLMLHQPDDGASEGRVVHVQLQLFAVSDDSEVTTAQA